MTMPFFLRVSLGVIFCVLSLGATPSKAQPQVDLSIAYVNQHLEVSLIPTASFQGVVSNVQFTLSWEGSADVLGSLQQLPGVQAYIPMRRAGSGWAVDAQQFQSFAGAGLMSMRDLPTNWEAETPVLLLKVAVSDPSITFALSEHPTVAERNGRFYAELNGVEASGTFRQATATGEPVSTAAAVSSPFIGAPYPNPAARQFTLPLTVQRPQTVQLSLNNLAGAELCTWTVNLREGQQQVSLELPALPDALYFLTIRSQGQIVSFHNLMIHSAR